MYRVIKQHGKWCAIEIGDLYDDLDNIEIFVNEAQGPVIIIDELQDLETNLGIDHDDIELID